MILQAAQKWEVDLKQSLMIGDTKLDEELARNCGLRFLRASGDGHIVPAFPSERSSG
jgi:histidinol phosphatase-like enzyme